ncbi:MAG: hypothetical protein ACQESR_18815 [Planctomycetota bacterium]
MKPGLGGPPIHLYRSRMTPSYDQFTQPLLEAREVTFCTYTGPDFCLDPRIDHVTGEGKLGRFLNRVWNLARTKDFDLIPIHAPRLAPLLVGVALMARPDLVRRTLVHLPGDCHPFRLRDRVSLLLAVLLWGMVVCGSNALRRRLPWFHRMLARQRLVPIPGGVDCRHADAHCPPHRLGVIDRAEDLQLVSWGRLCRGANMPLDVLRAWGTDCRRHVEQRYSLNRTRERFEMVLRAFDPDVSPEWRFFCRSVRGKPGDQRAA